MSLALALRGTVRDASTGAGPAGVVCLSRGGAFVAQATLQADGAFELQGQALEGRKAAEILRYYYPGSRLVRVY